MLGEIDDLRRRLRHYTYEPRRWHGSLRRVLFARAIQGSNSIEGINVTLDDAVAAVAGDEPLDASAEAWAAITGYRNAMTYVIQLAEDPHFRYSPLLLRSLHFMMLSYDLAKSPGLWRPGDVYVRNDASGEVVYEGPDADDVPGLIDELVDALNEPAEEPAMVRAGMAHLNLVMIHPFRDGNGRMARGLQTLVLAREGILSPHFSSIEEYLGRNTPAYYDVLAEVGGGSWQPDRDARPWIRFILTAHFRQASTLLRRVRESERLWERLEHVVEAAKLPDRTVYALFDAAVGFRVRNGTYRTVADVSEQTASRDLRRLVEKGLLVPVGERRGRHYVASEEIRNLQRSLRVRASKQIADPFAE